MGPERGKPATSLLFQAIEGNVCTVFRVYRYRGDWLTYLGENIHSVAATAALEIPKSRNRDGGLVSQVGQVSPRTRTRSYLHDHVEYRIQSDGESSGLRPQKIKDFIKVIERDITGKPSENGSASSSGK